MAAIGIAFGIIDRTFKAIKLVNSIIDGSIKREAFEEIKSDLADIKQDLNRIQNSLKVVLGEVKWGQVVTVLADSINTLEFLYNRLINLDINDKEGAKKLVDDVLLQDKVRESLFTIHTAMMGDNPALGGSVMELFSDKVSPVGYESLPQSRKCVAVDFLLSMLELQAKGYALLLNAYEASERDVATLKEEMKSRFKSQIELSKPYVNKLTYDFENVAWGEDYFEWYADDHYADTNAVVADDDKVVVGLQLYKKGNRIALKIAQAVTEFSKLDEIVMFSGSEWKENQDWNGNYFNLKDAGYVDANVNTIPVNTVVKGAALYQKGNRLGIKLFWTLIDPKTGKLGPTTGWNDTPGWDPGFFSGKDAKFCDTHSVVPSTLSCMSGAALYLKGNRIGVKIYSLSCRYEDPNSTDFTD